MPSFEVRRPDEVPPPRRSSRASQDQQRMYEEFIRRIDGNVGMLVLEPGEQLRSVKVRLRRAATRLSTELDIWDADGKVYFRLQQPRRRLRQIRNRAA